MITTLKNFKGFVIAYLESNRVNALGDYDMKGIYIFVEDVWIHPIHRSKKVFLDLIELVDQNKFYDNCIRVYWTILRDKHGKKILDPWNHKSYEKVQRIYDRDKLMLKLRGESRCLENCSI